MKLLERGFIFNAEEVSGPRRVCAFPCLGPRTADGIFLTFRLGEAKHGADGNCPVFKSGDGGRNWQMLSEGFQSTFDGHIGEVAGAVAELRPALLLAFLTWFDWSQKGKALYDAATDNILPSRMITAESRDGGRTWGDYSTLDTSPYGGCAGTGPPVRLADGRWLLSFESYENGKHNACGLTTQDGKAFSPIATIASDPRNSIFYWDQRLAFSERAGRPVAMFWAYDRKTEKDLPIHLAWGSADGLRWEQPFSTGIHGQIAAPIPLPDGRLLAFYVHRHPPGSLRLIASADGGKTWDAESEIVIHARPAGKERGAAGESDYAKYWEDMLTWTFGHPNGMVLDEKTLLLAYYAGERKECMSIYWARVAM